MCGAQSSGDQRGRGLAFSLTAVGSGRDAVSRDAGGGPFQTLPGPVAAVKHVWEHSSCGSATAGDQGVLQERLQARPGSSNVRVHSGRPTQSPTTKTTITTTTTHAQPDNPRIRPHAKQDANFSSHTMPAKCDDMKFNIPRRSRRSHKFWHPKVPFTMPLSNRFK